MYNKLISIIVPVYNVRPYLNLCVTSLINQTYTNIEILLIDDGSTDGSGDLCDSLSFLDSRIKVLHKRNGGLSDARNYGLDSASGDFIGFVDSDDWVSPKMFEILFHNIIHYKADISVCEKVLAYDTRIDDKGITREVEVLDSEAALDILFQDEKYKSHVWNKLFKKELFNNIRFPVGRNYEDIFIMHELFGNAQNIVFIDMGLYYYRQRENSIVYTNSYKNISDYNAALETRGDSKYALGREKYMLMQFVTVLRFIRSLDCKNDENFLILEQRVKNNILHRIRIQSGMHANRHAIQELFFKSLAVLVKDVIYAKYIVFIKILFDKRRIIQPTEKQRVILLGSPEYNNIGDLAIAYTMKRFFTELNKEVVYCEYPEFLLKYNVFPNNIRNSDLLCLIGGGNFGDIYMDQQKIRKSVFEKYPNNKIVVFPQTLYFTQTSDGKSELLSVNRILKGRNNITIFAREKKSYDFLISHMNCQSVKVVPDIVLMNSFSMPQGRDGILICLRRDIESRLTQMDRESILLSLYSSKENIDLWDTCLGYNVSIENRDAEVEKALGYVAEHKLIITDRLHGMIFAAITGTPCVCLDNINHKVQSVYKWIEELPYIIMVDDIHNINNVADELISEFPCGCESRMDKSVFEPLYTSINEIIGGSL